MRKFVYAATIAVAVVSAAAWTQFAIGTAEADVEPQATLDIMSLQAGAKDLPVAAIDGLI